MSPTNLIFIVLECYMLMEIASRRKNVSASVEHSSQVYFPTWVLAYGFEGVCIKWSFIASLELELLSLGWPFHSSVTMIGLALI
jgi:hypothetical protein